MSLPAIFTSVEGHLGSGHFAEAARLLQPIQKLRSDAELVAFRLLDSELAIEFGNASRGVAPCEFSRKALNRGAADTRRAHRVMARSYYHVGRTREERATAESRCCTV